MLRDKPRVTTDRRSRLFAGATALILLLAAGVGYRLLAASIQAAIGEVTPLAQPLSQIPLVFGAWRGTEVPLEVNVVSFDDEYVNRQYVNQETGRDVSLFVGYVGRPRVHFGHRPEVCFAAHGREQVGQEPLSLPAGDGATIPAVLYEFSSPHIAAPRTLVLATYLVNGRYTDAPDHLRRYNARNATLLGERTAYNARVQITVPASGDRAADVALLVELASQLSGPIAACMPYLD